LKEEVFEQSQAIALYTGPFLGLGETSVWPGTRREQVRMRFIRLVNRHCDQLQAAGQVDREIHWLERAIDVDLLVEPLYQWLIPLLVAQGRQADAGRYYQTCLQAYQQWETQGLSPTTLQLAQTLKN
jgi:two-component SAPR family response regulator